MTTAPRHRAPHSIASSAPTKSHPQSLARRLLLPPHSSEDLPPLLKLSPNAHPELASELYDFIAIALRAYINPWWTKLTRYDKEFLPHTNRIITHVIHALEERVHNVQHEALVFHDLPTIVTQHFVDFRNAQSKLSSSYASGGANSLSQLFAHIQPHMAISSDGQIDTEYYRQTIDLVLKACLPVEDYQPEVERVIIREVLVKVLVNDIFPKITQPWFIQKTILDLLGPIDDDPYPSTGSSHSVPPDTSFFQSMIIIILSALQSFSGACLALIHSYKQAITTIKLVNQTLPLKQNEALGQSAATALPPVVSSSEGPPTSLEANTAAPQIARVQSVSSASSTTSANPPANEQPIPSSQPPSQLQDYATAPLEMLSEIFQTQQRFSSSLLLETVSMSASYMSPFLDKLLPYLIERFLSPTFILNIARLSKRTLFPNGYPGPQPIEPTPEEQAQIRAQLVAWRGKGALAHLLPVILGPDPATTLERALDPLGDQKCNMRLLVFIVDRVLVALFPELIH